MPKIIQPTKIHQLETQISDLDTKYKRALADYQNLEKRNLQDKQNLILYTNESLLLKFLPVLDDLERAQSHLKDPGLALVIDHFYRQLESEGVTRVVSSGSMFNAETMDCVGVVDGNKDQVLKTVTTGYLYHKKVLRPAGVEVGSGRTSDDDHKAVSVTPPSVDSTNNIN